MGEGKHPVARAVRERRRAAVGAFGVAVAVGVGEWSRVRAGVLDGEHSYVSLMRPRLGGVPVRGVGGAGAGPGRC